MTNQMREEIQIVEINRRGEVSLFRHEQKFTTESQARAWILDEKDLPGDRMSDLILMVRTIYTSAREGK